MVVTHADLVGNLSAVLSINGCHADLGQSIMSRFAQRELQDIEARRTNAIDQILFVCSA
jgi:hypothetical protein